MREINSISSEDFKVHEYDDIIDVRSPNEFNEDHLPNALNLPVLDNSEREEIGTIYKNENPFIAKRKGAALVSFNSALKNQMLENNTTGTSNVVDCALKHNIQKICHVSSIATLGSNEQNKVDENCIWDWTNKSSYAISKYLAEMEVWRAFGEGLKGFIVNPSLIIGPGSWNSGIGTIINKASLGMPFYPPGSCGVIDVNDLVEIMIQLMHSNITNCLLYTSPSPRDRTRSRMPSSA